MRLDDWETRLHAALLKHGQLPAQLGVSDCYIICADAVVACTGKEPFEGVRGKYKTAQGAARLLRKRGFETVENAWGSLFNPIAPSLAQRGDLLVFNIDGEVLAAPLLAQGGVVKTGDGSLSFVPVSQAITAFKVV